MSLEAEASQELWVVVGVIDFSLGGEAHALFDVVLAAEVQPVVAPLAEAQQVPPVVAPPCALLHVVDVQRFRPRPAHGTERVFAGECR
jgi:hypothetical protein